jgi:aryl-alcohol dehydrogenase-like predicted oxidoreductase
VSLTTSAARGIDRAGASRALHAALEAGLELVDIAPDDDSERLVGETLRTLRLRDTVIAAPRVPVLRATPSGATTRDALVDRLPPRYVVSRIESALRTTRLDALPLAQLELRAAWRSSSAWPELVGTCARLVREGKVLDWGALVDRVEEDTGDLAFEPWLASLSLPFSLYERTAVSVFAAAAKATEVPAAQASGSQHLAAAGLTPELAIAAGMPADLILAAVATSSSSSSSAGDAPPPKAPRGEPIKILARRPLAGGALAGILGPGAKLKQRDDRNALDARQLERIAVAAAKLAAFAKHTPPAARSCDAAKLALEQMKRPDQLHADTIADLALRYVTTRGAIALPRLHRHEHVIHAFAASLGPPLPVDLVDALENLDI